MAKLLKLETAPDLVDRVHGVLIAAICSGELAPGTRLTQEEIAQQLAVSRQPVLQALRLLKNDGFILDAPGRGVLVAPLDGDWFRQIYEVRSALDALAARLAAQSAHLPNGYKLNADLMARGRTATKRSQIDQLIALDIEFHTAIYAAANNPLIEKSATLHWRHIRRAMGLVLQSNQRNAVWDEHEAIANAIANGEAHRAESLMRQHVDQAGKNLSARLQELQKTA